MATTIHSITPALAHVGCEENLLVRNVQALAEEHAYRSVFSIDGAHPYLYENPSIANHVSGTTFIDMGRQLLKAISHLYYGAPVDCRFVLHTIDMEFVRWAKLGVDIEVTVTVDADAARRADAPRGYGASLVWRQEGHLIARASSRFTLLSAALEAKLMSRQYGKAPVEREPISAREPAIARAEEHRAEAAQST
ncbi:MAG: AfsA-related hotdog domain-containing protein [Byssovorax sp.]